VRCAGQRRVTGGFGAMWEGSALSEGQPTCARRLRPVDKSGHQGVLIEELLATYRSRITLLPSLAKEGGPRVREVERAGVVGEN